MIIRRLRLYHLLLACLGLLALLALRGEAWSLGSTPVTVVNPADIAKAEGIQHPFVMRISCDSPANFCTSTFDVPATQRLILEYVSAICSMGNGVLVEAALGTTFSGVPSTSEVLLGNPVFLGGTAFKQSVGQAVRLYVDPGTRVFVDFTQTGDNINCGGSVHGQAIDVP